ncbi:unnamed protein product [Rotaria magnacalcarata]|uniref:long-chain-fatty-acid--CoA ligase n=2 Tax=Rotaria magnacalcarata TaxID=392030 RepID=A0A818YLV8_9BILA|nr:unnamed protein product [Rotaria magnacalcarata]CAF1522622.1 unnamed protein product [Rotaria magnacalcarata]CAF2096082.1 unnamed protein product [Rotaria magnacalcarata]CAF2132000.1 unnamed protein product [Rotaria magnacalcarata]CAF2192705.1 unnamed protein product [Rotaria magnacalcarata]
MPSSFSKSNGTYAALATGAIAVTYAGTHAYKSRIQRSHDDGIDLKNQTVEIDPVEHIRRCTFYKDIDLFSFYKTIYPNIQTLGDVFYNGYSASKNGPCIAYVDPAKETEPLNWISYSTALERIRIIGSHLWTEAKLTPMKSTIAIMSLNRAEYAFVEHAGYMYGFIILGLYTSYNSEAIISILEKTKTEVLIVDNLDRIESFKNQLLEKTYLKEILIMDDVTSSEHPKIKNIPTVLKTMQQSDVRPRPKIDPDSIASYILTSGTTGEPKIAMLSHGNFLSTTKAGIDRRERANMGADPTNRHCSFLPMAHLYERLTLLSHFFHGVQVVFCPIPEKLFEYYPIVKPTNLSMVPRILNKVYDTIMMEVNKSKIKRFLISQALHNEQPTLFSRLIFRKVRKLFGGEAIAMLTGSAPITHEVLHFFRIALDIPVVEAYGQTESTAAGTSTHVIDMSCGTVGSPGAAVEIKLIDVPSTNYRSSNNQGEICLRGPCIFKGYYGDEAKTRETIDEGGWLHTGDVGEWTSTGALRIIDRVKHIFKLSQGEYVAPERLEDGYIRSRWIAQIFVDGISTESAVVAIVIPDEEYVRNNFRTAHSNMSFEDICKDEKLKEIILTDLHRLAREYKYHRYETIINIHLHPEILSQENGLITSTLKTRRTATRQYFQHIIHSLYQPSDRIEKPKNVEEQSKL